VVSDTYEFAVFFGNALETFDFVAILGVVIELFDRVIPRFGGYAQER
jgi:hypothetical protein